MNFNKHLFLEDKYSTENMEGKMGKVTITMELDIELNPGEEATIIEELSETYGGLNIELKQVKQPE